MRTLTYTSRLAILAAGVALLVVGCVPSASAQQSQPPFTSAAEASQALYQAAKGGDQAALNAILGPELEPSDNDIEGKTNQERFVQKYNEMHRLIREPDGTTVLYIGAENWPFPVPLLEQNGKWQFDAQAGSKEILARQIGRNEITALQICEAFVTDANGGGANHGAIQQFALALHNRSNTNSISHANAFGGYAFKVIDDKGDSVGLVAYPVEYRESGIVTFIVTPNGSLYQKDLGVHTAELAQKVRGKPAGDWLQVR